MDGAIKSFEARATAKFDQLDAALTNQAAATGLLALAAMLIGAALIWHLALEATKNA